MTLSFRNKLLSGYVVVLALMVIVTAIVILSVKSLMENFAWVDHTYKVLNSASEITASAIDMETGMRGFLLAGKEEFLEPYDSGKIRLFSLLDSLSETVSDNPSQVQLLIEIRDNIKSWDDNVVQAKIDKRRAVGEQYSMYDVAALVGEARGKTYFDRFREQIETFKQRERVLMEERMDTLFDTESLVISSSLFGTLLAIVIGFFVAFTLTNHIFKLLGGEPVYIAEMARKVASGELDKNANDKVDAHGIYADMLKMVGSLHQKAMLARNIAEGDLKQNVDVLSQKDTLGSALSTMTKNLNQILSRTQVATREISQGTQSVSDTSKVLSSGANEQARSLELISTSLRPSPGVR